MKDVPNYVIQSPKERFLWVLFTIVFGFLFFMVFEPFGIFVEEGYSNEEVVFGIAIASLLAFVILLITQFAVKEVLSISSLSWWQFGLWFLIEALLISCAWSVADLIEPRETISFLQVFPENFIGFTLVFGLPYFGFVLWRKGRTVNLAAPNHIEETPDAVTISDETGKTKIIIKLSSLLYLNSADNYVEIHLLNDHNVETKVIRNTLKNLESLFSNTKVLRCHRSYMVNSEKITKAVKTSSGMQLQLDKVHVHVPVSKSYISEIEKAIER
ncbi:MAG: LytTR family transcriptional regulator DNA-binding domain-containing protein [Bacteroidia bacterium]